MSTSTEIGRKVELWLCDTLNTALAPLVAYPSMGGSLDANGDDSGDAIDTPTGPYIGVRVIDAEERLNNETWAIVVEVIYISNMADVSSPVHATVTRSIRDCLNTLRASCQGLYEPIHLQVHGMEVATGEKYNDDGDQSHGDAAKVTLGVSG